VARGAFRGAATAWLGLVALQVVTTSSGSSKVGGVLNWVNSVVSRALDPNVAALPDYSTATAGINAVGGTVPDYTLPYLSPNAVITRPSAAPVLGHPVPN
jgi:hypothetical protein